MTDKHRGYVLYNAVKSLIDRCHRQTIKRRCRLIKYNERCILVQRPRQSNFLLLPAGKINPFRIVAAPDRPFQHTRSAFRGGTAAAPSSGILVASSGYRLFLRLSAAGSLCLCRRIKLRELLSQPDPLKTVAHPRRIKIQPGRTFSPSGNSNSE